MESRCKADMVMASIRRGGGLQVLGYRGFLMVTLLFVIATKLVIEDVHCITTDAVAPTSPTQRQQDIGTFNQYEADALNAVFKMWSRQTPQLSTLLNWTSVLHPCDNLNGGFPLDPGSEFPGAWSGVGCYSELQNVTEFKSYYHISVVSLAISGSDFICLDAGPDDRNYDNFPCGFEGITGGLPAEICNLTNLQYITINHNPRLTGPVPPELFQMPNLIYLDLSNNSLSGTLPSDVYNEDCRLSHLDLSNNNFSGRLPVNSNGALFCQYLYDLDLSNNHFEGKFSIGNVEKLNLSYNDFTNYSKSIEFNGSDTIYMPLLSNLIISNNNFSGSFLEEFIQMPSLSKLNISKNNFNGTFFTGAYLNPSIIDLSNNQFNDITFHNKTTPSNGNISLPSLEEIYFQNNNFRGQFPSEILTATNLQILI